MTVFLSLILFCLWPQIALSQLVFDSQSVDFGKVWRGQKMYKDLDFVNASKGPLRIEAIDSGCGCMAIEREVGKLYRPGEKGSIRIKFDTENFRGSLERRIGILTGDGPIQNIKIKARIEETFKVEPPIVDFGQLDISGGETKSIALKSLANKAITIKSFRSNFSFASIIKSSNGTSLEVTLQKPLARGKYSGAITLETDDYYFKEVTVPVFLTLGSEVVQGSGYLEFGPIAKGESRERSLRIVKKANETFTLKNASFFLNGEIVPLRLVNIASEQTGFRVRVTNGLSKIGAFSGKLNLVSDAGSEVGVEYFGFFK